MSAGPVLLVEDDDVLRAACVQALELAGLAVEPFESAVRATRHVMPSFAGCVVTDIRMADMDGLELFARVRAIDPDIPVILMTGHGDIDMAVRAMRDGAFDFLPKPFAIDHLAGVISRALQSRRLVLDNRALRQALADPRDDLIAQSRAMAQLRTLVAQVAPTGIDLVIEGESGSGKESWARQLHRQSPRHAGPFCVVAGGGGASDQDLGEAAERSHGGTLFIDAMEGMPRHLQQRLGALLDARDRSRSGHDDAPDFRLIAASAVPVDDAGLSSDLAYRLAAVRLTIPPLRQRREDIPALFARFVREALDQTGRKRFEMSAADRKRLLEHDWPGNVRELRSYAFAAVLNLPRSANSAMQEGARTGLAARLAQFERMVIMEALEATGGNVVRTCALLQIPRKSLYDKLQRHGIRPSDFRGAGKSAPDTNGRTV